MGYHIVKGVSEKCIARLLLTLSSPQKMLIIIYKYPHINNDIEYGLFKDVIDSYYLDSEIKDNFTCNQNCHMNTQHEQHDQT